MPKDAEESITCENCNGTGRNEATPMFPDDDLICPACKGTTIGKQGNMIWIAWKLECDKIDQHRQEIFAEIKDKELRVEPSIVLDPFVGSGTTPLVAKRLGRDYIGIDLSDKYLEDLAGLRLENTNPLFDAHPR